MSHPRNKVILNEVVMNVGSLNEILSYVAVFLLGAEKWVLGLSALLVSIVTSNLLSRGWLKLIKE